MAALVPAGSVRRRVMLLNSRFRQSFEPRLNHEFPSPANRRPVCAACGRATLCGVRSANAQTEIQAAAERNRLSCAYLRSGIALRLFRRAHLYAARLPAGRLPENARYARRGTRGARATIRLRNGQQRDARRDESVTHEIARCCSGSGQRFATGTPAHARRGGTRRAREHRRRQRPQTRHAAARRIAKARSESATFRLAYGIPDARR